MTSVTRRRLPASALASTCSTPHSFAAPYRPADHTSAGGGPADEGEDIEVVELPFDEALAMVDDGRTADARIVMLLHWAALRGPFRP